MLGSMKKKLILKELAIERMARMPHHDIDASIGTRIYIKVAPKNQDLQD